LGRYDEALETMEEAARLFGAHGDIEQEGRVVAEIAEVHFLRGTVKEGRERIRPVMERLERQGPSAALAALYAARVQETVPGEKPAVERAAELARIVRDERLLVWCEAYRGAMLMDGGRLGEAWQVLHDILPIAEGHPDYYALGLVLAFSSEILKVRGLLDQCHSYRVREAAYAENAGDPTWLMYAESALGEVLFLLGRWQEARAHFGRAEEISRAVESYWHSFFGRIGMATLDLAEGAWDAASRQIEACLADAERSGHTHWSRIARRLLSLRDLLDCHPADALCRLEQLASEEETVRTWTQVLLARAYLETGDTDRATRLIDRVIGMTRAQGHHLDLCEALLVHGKIQGKRGELEAAARSLSEARSLAAAMPYPLMEGRILFEQGRRSLEQGDSVQARHHLEEALQVFRRLGAGRDAEQTQQMLLQLSI
jgi:tetratricopeptide (TPR) repeat protein